MFGGAVALSACAGGAAARTPGTPLKPVPGGDPERGLRAIRAYGCGACHAVPGANG
jgi:hypothetical protein